MCWVKDPFNPAGPAKKVVFWAKQNRSKLTKEAFYPNNVCLGQVSVLP
jgi:hypothetical protein